MSADGLLDISNALLDSPQFRGQVRQFDSFAGQLEAGISALHKTSKQLRAASQEYHARLTEMIQQITAISKLSPLPLQPKIDSTLQGFSEHIGEIERNRQLQTEQLQEIVVQPLISDAESGRLAQVKQTKKQADALQSDYEAQLSRLMSKKPTEDVGQLEQSVEAAKLRYVSKMQSLSLEYNLLASVGQSEFLESFLSLMYAQYAYHHQAFSSLRDFEPEMRQMGEVIAQKRRKAHESIGEARDQVVEPQSARGSVGGYMQVGQHEDDNSVVETVADAELHPPATRHRRKVSRSQRRSLASISLSPHGLFQMSGYLFLRSQYSLMASWQRRWFEITNGALKHCLPDERDCETVPLHLCMVKRGTPADNRRNVFELIAPNRTYLLQAESLDELNAWKACLKQAIETSLYAHSPRAQHAEIRPASQPPADSSHPLPNTVEVRAVLSTQSSSMSSDSIAVETQAQRVDKLQRPRGNDKCVDCGKAGPEWASINLGALMCIDCSGIHRSLGVHVSKVRSIKLDHWEPEQLQLMQRLGNARVNRVYEQQQQQQSGEKIDESSTRGDKQPYLQRKYADREFVAGYDGDMAAKLVQAAETADLPTALEALAQGADANSQDSQGKLPLMAAVEMGDFAMLELLLQWGADINRRAQISASTYKGSSSNNLSEPAAIDGTTALHLAVRLGNVRMVWFLIRKGAQWDTPDGYGLLPLDIALEASNVQVVMALRYAAFQKASGLAPGTLKPRQRLNGSQSTASSSAASNMEPVDMLDMDDSFIRGWAVPPYSPFASSSDSSDEEQGSEFGELQTAL